VAVWLPVPGPVPVAGRVRLTDVPGGWFAVAVHDGPDDRLDETYAALGGAVAARGTSAGGPVREHYLAGVLGDPRPLVTEIAWPVTGPG
jgi:effector-binding domain-containing protein